MDQDNTSTAMGPTAVYQKAIRTLMGRDENRPPYPEDIVAELAARDPRLFISIVDSLRGPTLEEKARNVMNGFIGGKVDDIKAVRSVTGWSLKEAKEFVEDQPWASYNSM